MHVDTPFALAMISTPLPIPSPPTPLPPTLSVSSPVWSIGKHGPTSELVKRLRPLLFKYRVSAYLCGHDHSMQHLREVNTTLDYFVVGAGHLTETSDHHKVSWLRHTPHPLAHPVPSLPCRRVCLSILCSTGMLQVTNPRSMVHLPLSVLITSHSTPPSTAAKVGWAGQVLIRH